MIGGGLAGLATAIGLAERGQSVTLLEARRVGWGASGRNGGFVSAGYAQSMDKIRRRVGDNHACELFQLSRQAMTLIQQRIAKYAVSR